MIAFDVTTKFEVVDQNGEPIYYLVQEDSCCSRLVYLSHCIKDIIVVIIVGQNKRPRKPRASFANSDFSASNFTMKNRRFRKLTLGLRGRLL